jgi:hypothetical protein
VFRYSASLLKAIDEFYVIKDGENEIYAGIEVNKRGIPYLVTSPFDIAEFKVDFERACKYLHKVPGKDHLGYKDITEALIFLNGE